MRTDKRGGVDAAKHLEKMVGPFTFGMFVRSTRTLLGISQAEAARRIGVSRGVLCDIEKERQLVSVELAREIASRLRGGGEALAVEACLQDQLRKAKMTGWRVRLDRAEPGTRAAKKKKAA
jgi:DNA-binding XRE family transcriptional regulator